MSTAFAVIGAGWGDEGKGLMTDALATPGSVVVRANGGAQAGHTVRRPDGTRHVFHHVGSGALRGAATFLSRFFIHNPILLLEELTALDALGISPALYADPAGLVTTPWDMMINQIAEEARSDGRHGSCGMGINETIRRSEHEEFRLHFRDLADPARLRGTARRIQHEWGPTRLAALGFQPSENWRARLAAGTIAERFVQDAEDMACIVMSNDGGIAKASARVGALIFEGAQGLLLDQDHPFFPYVTPSKTGLANPSTLATEWGIEKITAIYMTRAYATRHGAGPFPRATPGMVFADETNVPNEWQGALRFGALDLDLLAAAIHKDEARAPVQIEKYLAMTCMDQIGDRAVWWQNDAMHRGAGSELFEAARAHLGLPVAAVSHGAYRENVAFLSGFGRSRETTSLSPIGS